MTILLRYTKNNVQKEKKMLPRVSLNQSISSVPEQGYPVIKMWSREHIDVTTQN